jgi:hypothetical protein
MELRDQLQATAALPLEEELHYGGGLLGRKDVLLLMGS